MSGKGLEVLWAPRPGSDVRGMLECGCSWGLSASGLLDGGPGPPWRVPRRLCFHVCPRPLLCVIPAPEPELGPWGLFGVEFWAEHGQSLGCVCSGCGRQASGGGARPAACWCGCGVLTAIISHFREGVCLCVRVGRCTHVCLCACARVQGESLVSEGSGGPGVLGRGGLAPRPRPLSSGPASLGPSPPSSQAEAAAQARMQWGCPG